eukprot:256589_1
MNVERFLMNDHVTFHCPHTTTRCDHCGEEIFRKDLNNHGCNEVPCPYAKYGCDTRVLKRDLPGEMQQHLATDEVNHLRMKVAFLEDVMKQCPDCMAQVRHMEHERNRESDEFVEEHKEIEVSERVYQRQARYPPPPNPPTSDAGQSGASNRSKQTQNAENEQSNQNERNNGNDNQHGWCKKIPFDM